MLFLESVLLLMLLVLTTIAIFQRDWPQGIFWLLVVYFPRMTIQRSSK
jgi:hypothetical protein